jgi:phosphate-selective porin OprO and OprP
MIDPGGRLASLFLLCSAFAGMAQLAAAEVDDSKATAAEADEGKASPRDSYGPNLGFGFLVDTATYIQDEASKAQMALNPDVKLRDLRLLVKGRFNPRLSYSLGYMYDGDNDVWRFRQTGLMINVPELSGSFFIGRTKEGFSTNKLMVGYHGWTIERSAANDAFLPILADGVKWTGTLAGGSIVYNLGAFTGGLTDQPYIKNDYQYVARIVGLPLEPSDSGALLHLALQARYGASKKGNFQFRSKPESFSARSQAVDTGKFPASASTAYGVEAYFRPGPLLIGSEYFVNLVSSAERDDPYFHGGEILAAYTLTGEVRPYKANAALFEAISPSRPVFSGGPGAWELVVRYSYVDLDSGPISGGRFQRLTPMVNWHLTDNVRLEAAYGYSLLHRLGQLGRTQFFQTRIQLSF